MKNEIQGKDIHNFEEKKTKFKIIKKVCENGLSSKPLLNQQLFVFLRWKSLKIRNFIFHESFLFSST